MLDDVPDGLLVPSSSGQQATLGVGVDDRGLHVRVTLGGELDLATSTLLDAMLDGLLRKRRVPRVVSLEIYTAAVTFADAAGISPLLHARAVLARRGGSLTLPDPSPSVHRLLTLLGLSSVLGGAMETPA